MKIRDIFVEHRDQTIGYDVDIKMSDYFLGKYKNDSIPNRKELIKNALNDLLSWYNHKGSLHGKIKPNNDSDKNYHYHIGYPYYVVGANSRYSTSDWFVLYTLYFDVERNLYIIDVYDYDHHNRRKDWNEK